MDHPITGLVTAAGAWVKTGLAIYVAELERQNLLRKIGQSLGVDAKTTQS